MRPGLFLWLRIDEMPYPACTVQRSVLSVGRVPADEKFLWPTKRKTAPCGAALYD
ncbi:hypothetical protein UYSO10_1044 [Kosakonia radicincitans]|nr:hypothetical protein UYSO10_1044 [Kosakonia radicincitans]